MSQPYAPIAQYTFRRSVFESDQTYIVYPDRIDVEGAGVGPRRYLLNDVRTIHLKYEHTKQRAYYQCIIRFTRARLSFRHLHWMGPGKFEDRRATYTPFVKALLGELSRFPDVQYKAGSMVNFISAILGVPIMAALGLLALAHDRTGSAALAGLMLGICLLMIPRSRPRRLDPLAPPADLLPE